MRGCSCAGSTCSCRIQAADGTIVVTGTGTASDPIQISAGEIPIDDKIEFTEGDFIDLTVGGSGTDLDPITVEVELHTGTTSTLTPTTGQTLTPGADVRNLVLTPAGTLATLTITLPADPTMLEHEIIVTSSAILTALTVGAAGGNTVVGAPSSMAAHGFFRMKLFGTVWRRVG